MKKTHALYQPSRWGHDFYDSLREGHSAQWYVNKSALIREQLMASGLSPWQITLFALDNPYSQEHARKTMIADAKQYVLNQGGGRPKSVGGRKYEI